MSRRGAWRNAQPGWRDVVAAWPKPTYPDVPLVPWQQTHDERLQSAPDTQAQIDWVIRDPNLYRLAAAIPHPTEADIAITGGRRRDYPEWALILFGELVAVTGSANAAQKAIHPTRQWRRVLETVAGVLGPDHVQGLPENGPTRYHWITFKKQHLEDNDLPGIISAFEEIAAGRALEVGLFDPRVKMQVSRPSRLRTVSLDGKVSTSPTSHIKPTYVDKATGEIKKRRRDPAVGWWAEGGDEKRLVRGSKATWAMAQHTMANIRVVLSIRAMEPHDPSVPKKLRAPRPTEAMMFMSMARRIAHLLSGADLFIADGAWRGRHVTKFMAETGRQADSRVYSVKSNKKNRKSITSHGVAFKAEVLPFLTGHPARKWPNQRHTGPKGDWSCPGHHIYAAAGTLWEAYLDADGQPHVERILRGRNKRHNPNRSWTPAPACGCEHSCSTTRPCDSRCQCVPVCVDVEACPSRCRCDRTCTCLCQSTRESQGGDWEWHGHFLLKCRHDPDQDHPHVHDWWERLTQNRDDDLAGFNRGEYLRLREFPSEEGGRVYHMRSAVESLNNTSEHTWYRDRIPSWGMRGQMLDRIMLGMAIDSIALAVYTSYAERQDGATLPWLPDQANATTTANGQADQDSNAA